MGFWVSGRRGGGGGRPPGWNSFSYNSFRISETTIFRNICQWLLLKKVLLKTISFFWMIFRDTPKERLFSFNTILDSSKRLNSPISLIKSSPCKRVTYRNLSNDSQYKPLNCFYMMVRIFLTCLLTVNITSIESFKLTVFCSKL